MHSKLESVFFFMYREVSLHKGGQRRTHMFIRKLKELLYGYVENKLELPAGQHWQGVGRRFRHWKCVYTCVFDKVIIG